MRSASVAVVRSASVAVERSARVAVMRSVIVAVERSASKLWCAVPAWRQWCAVTEWQWCTVPRGSGAQWHAAVVRSISVAVVRSACMAVVHSNTWQWCTVPVQHYMCDGLLIRRHSIRSSSSKI